MKKEINTLTLNHTIELLEKYESKLNTIKYDSEMNPGTDKELSEYKMSLLEIDIKEVKLTIEVLKSL